jgi:hypothetical protein
VQVQSCKKSSAYKNYRYFGKYELMAIMLIGVCIEKTHGGDIISFLFFLFVIDVCIERMW